MPNTETPTPNFFDIIFLIVTNHGSDILLDPIKLRPYTKAHKIFIRKEYDFLNEDDFWKELLVYILHNVDNSEYLQLYKSITPLEFDDGLLVSILRGLKNDMLKQEYLDHLKCLYEDVKDINKRRELLNIIGNENIFLDLDNENEENQNAEKNVNKQSPIPVIPSKEHYLERRI
jgi:hypothetical protein